MAWHEQIHFYDSTASTMLLADTLAKQGAAHGTTVVAASQTAGRGRRGRSWLSAPYAGIWATTIVYPDSALDIAQLSIVASVAVWRSLQHMQPTVSIGLKWPNDIVCNQRKLAGILLEVDYMQASTACLKIGIGINLLPRAALVLPSNIEDCYIGLQEIIKHDNPQVIYQRVLQRMLYELEAAYNCWLQQGLRPFLTDWQCVDSLRNQTLRAETDVGFMIGTYMGLAADGRLNLATAQGVQSIASGEVVHLRKTE